MAILVTGGAGYIGSHLVAYLIEKGMKVIVIDNLQTGHREAIHPKAIFYKSDIRSSESVMNIFMKEKIEAVFHFAAASLVGESTNDPLKYYDVNVSGTRILLEVMSRYGVKYLVFSSSAAVYGDSHVQPIKENFPLKPTNPYGETKLAMERMIKWWGDAFDASYVSLRYFNAASAKETGELGEDHLPETHLIPIILQAALGIREYVTVYGDNYPTKDGTCIRDFIHVEDLAEAHLMALRYLQNGGKSDVLNLGNTSGYSVKEVISTSIEETGKNIKVIVGERRSGDPAELIACSDKAFKILGWKPSKSSIRKIIQDAWRWHKKHPEGYKSKSAFHK
ncbi:UDP-glucose 4-epimerase GalE [Bacillus sp. DTU_2020_1000418_1_SI_GHA_SEK_038]|uniref:UDP-glucose 4-epimerase GalE n=1 Tax=Bacillus sp. DTU_2020_1000418_1_SI_GHA_SEK_038 TaxID=3077585 RepID=UPI0028E5E874|nr:UDP-glucose 4-epimerase GalE [Bacillus sp. DTU_2020_1000418_1_SI_GHA_SEK_038]WNS73819.1 UDP-glucose 4-epimerase GalE [Bacillus sp. DTU_2020_1000418_1_SI_GHA_SEK_038]